MKADTRNGLVALFFASAIPMGIFFAIEYHARGVDSAIRLVATATLCAMVGVLMVLLFVLAYLVLDYIIIQLARERR